MGGLPGNIYFAFSYSFGDEIALEKEFLACSRHTYIYPQICLREKLAFIP